MYVRAMSVAFRLLSRPGTRALTSQRSFSASSHGKGQLHTVTYQNLWPRARETRRTVLNFATVKLFSDRKTPEPSLFAWHRGESRYGSEAQLQNVLGLRVQGSGLRVQGLGSKFRV